MIHPLAERGTVVAEPLFHGHPRHPSADADLHGAAKSLDWSGGVVRDGPNWIDPALGIEYGRTGAQEGGHSQHTKGLHCELR